MTKQNEHRDQYLCANATTLLEKCKQTFYIGSGKGGQHRNKTESGVRLLHEPTQITVTDCSGRYREENRLHAIKKLKKAIALACREDSAPLPQCPPPSVNHETWPLWCARLLDVWSAHNSNIPETARIIGCSTGQLLRWVQRDPQLYQFIKQHNAPGSAPLETHEGA